MEKVIKASDVELALASAKLARFTKGRTTPLAAMTPGSFLEVDCSHGYNPSQKHPGMYATARKLAADGKRGTTAVPMNRGLLGLLIEKVRQQRGTQELRRTFGCGIQALRAEPRFALRRSA